MHPFRAVVLLLLSLSLLSAGCHWCRRKPESKVRIDFLDTSGPVPKSLEKLQIGDSLALGLSGLAPGQGVDISLSEGEREWTGARLFADMRGTIEPTVVWYYSGVGGAAVAAGRSGFRTFEEAERYFKGRTLNLLVRDRQGNVLGERRLEMVAHVFPHLYPSDANGLLLNATNATGGVDLYVTGRHLPPGATVHLYVVNNKTDWVTGDALNDVTGQIFGPPEVDTITLAPGQTGFTHKVWDESRVRRGRYDIVARIGGAANAALLDTDHLISDLDTGFIFYRLITVGGHAVIDSSAKVSGAFEDRFKPGEAVYAQVDPLDVPPLHPPNAQYAKFWVVDHQGTSHWDGVATLTAVAGSVNPIMPMKGGCINCSRVVVWPNGGAGQTELLKHYDIVVDFGAVDATAWPRSPTTASTTRAGTSSMATCVRDSASARRALPTPTPTAGPRSATSSKRRRTSCRAGWIS